MQVYRDNSKQSGYIAVVTLALLLVLLGTGIGYLKWSADESVEFKRQYAITTAYYMAQSAISQEIIPYLCSINGPIPSMTQVGNPSVIDFDIPEGMEGEYYWHAQFVPAKSSQTAYGQTSYYNVNVTGKIVYQPFNRYGDNNREIEVDTTLYIQYNAANTWGIFMYLTNYETTIFGEKIRFFNGDTLWGRVHSNDQIAIMQSPVFYEKVSTTASNFEQGIGYNPIFYVDPLFNVPPVYFPTTLEDLRGGASSQGNFINNPGGLYQFRILFKGNDGATIYRWPLGTPFSDTVAVPIAFYNVFDNTGIFVDGRLEMLGTDPVMRNDMGVSGRVSVGASGDIWLLDNVRYVDSNRNTGVIDSSTTNMLGIMSEGDILIANTMENGRDNGAPSTDPWRNDIIINGGIVALGESFSFEDQNDVITAYGGTLPFWYYSNGPNPDERGQIHLWGQVSQTRRGYVHRSNHGGTGYLKDYHYDSRFYFDPPPFYPYLDANAAVDRQISAWGVGEFPVEPDPEQEEPGSTP